MSKSKYAVGYYTPTETFQAISEHVCVMREDRPDGGTPVAVCGPAGDPQSESDAWLFVAAPDMLDALRAMYDAYVNGATGSFRVHLVLQAEAAIAKAEGRAASGS